MKFGKSKIFLLLCLSFVVGVFFAKYLNYYVMAFAAMIFVALISVFWRRKTFMIIGFAGLVLLGGALRLQTSFPNDDPNFIGKLYDQKVELEGVIVREPDVRSGKTYLTLQPQGFTGRVLLSVGRYPEYQYGDRLKIAGKLEEPFESEDFSYKNYLSRYDTYAVVYFPKIEKLASNQGNAVKSGLLAVKHKFQEVLSKSLPEPQNALALGLILGLKRSLPEDLKNALIIVGVSHIVVISGYNISIITRNLLRTRAWWGRKAAFWLSLLAVTAFVIITGGEASVIRAAVGPAHIFTKIATCGATYTPGISPVRPRGIIVTLSSLHSLPPWGIDHLRIESPTRNFPGNFPNRVARSLFLMISYRSSLTLKVMIPEIPTPTMPRLFIEKPS